MRVLVSDTSVLIDLERGMLLEAAFRLPYEFVVPDLLYKRELRDLNGNQLQKLGLHVADLDDQGVAKALLYRGKEPALSLADAFAISLAQTHSWVLLTGDQALRRLANEEQLSCHGVLWVFDQMHHCGIASTQALQEGLSNISAHPRCRLPSLEVKKRIKIYSLAKGAA
jgi:predicted nucleic acid-binding protein